jgi:hypothetical protein
MKTNKFFIFLFIFLVSFNLISSLEIGTEGEIGLDLITSPTITTNGTSTVNTNSSENWVTNLGSLDDANATQFENNGGTLNILESWLTSFVNNFGFITDLSGFDTDDLAEGSINLYDNQTWNEAYANTKYSDIQWGYNQTQNSDGEWIVRNDSMDFNLNNTKLNEDFNQTQVILDNNSTWSSTYNETYALYAYNQTSDTFTLYNSSWDQREFKLYWYNHTEDTFNLYNSSWDQSYLDIWNYNQSEATFEMYNSTWDNRGYVDSQDALYNSLITDYVDNQDSAYNTSMTNYVDNNFAGIEWDYNQTEAGDDRFINVDGDSDMTGTFEYSGGWGSGGLSIIGGDLFAQTGYFYNLTGLSINSLNVNGSIIPQFNNAFDIGSADKRYRDLYLSRNAIINGSITLDGEDVGKWLYNETLATFNLYNSTWDQSYLDIWNYNQTLATFNLYGDNWYNHTLDTFNLYGDNWYNHTLDTFNLYNSTWDNRAYINSEIAGVNTTANIKSLGFYEGNFTDFTFNTYNSTWDNSADIPDVSTYLENNTQVYFSKVGIGTSSPGKTLDVRGDAVFNEAGGDNDFRIEGDTEPYAFMVDAGDDLALIGGSALKGTDNKLTIVGDYDSSDIQWALRLTQPGAVSTENEYGVGLQFKFDNSGADTKWGGIGYVNRLGFGNQANMVFYTHSSATPNGAEERMRIAYDGRVGIGTDAPAYTLDVDGIIKSRSTIRATTSVLTGSNDNLGMIGTGSYPGIQWRDDDTTLNAQILGAKASGIMFFDSNSYFSWRNAPNSGEIMRLTNDGKLGIGTSSPASELEVDGDAKITGEAKGFPRMLQCNDETMVMASNTNYLDVGNQKMDSDTGWTMIRDGSITGMSLNYDLSVFGDGVTTLVLEVRKNGAVVWSESIQKTSGSGINEYFTQARNTDTFSAGDTLQLSVTASGGVSMIHYVTMSDMIGLVEIIYD